MGQQNQPFIFNSSFVMNEIHASNFNKIIIIQRTTLQLKSLFLMYEFLYEFWLSVDLQ